MRNSVQEYVREQNGKRILEMKSGNKENRMDGYMNMLNKYGTTQDSSTAYIYSSDGLVSDMELTDQYISNGLFAKIIDAPAEEAVKHGYDFKLNDQETEDFISDELDRLDWEETAATAIKWTRLYGGAIIVMLVDDGCDLEDPLDWDAVEEIEELRVYERAIVEPDYSSLYAYNPEKVRRHGSKFQKPEFYHVNSQFGRFKVHESRCLVFQNGKLPEKIIYSTYQFFGIPEYLRLQQALQDTIVSHSDGVKLLERCIQAIYKMKNLSNLLSTAEGEEKVLKRLEVIDLARGILNSLVIDSEGEDYDFKSMPLSGVKDIIDSACNMLSAITNIPQTILFGRSPAGENSTGESDMENYYNFVNKIQKMMLKKNLRVLLDLIFECGRKNGKVAEIPAYKVGFVPLWSLSETEQANVDAVKATTEQTKAATAQVYVDMQVLDPSEVRAGLKKSEEYTINDLLNEEDDLDLAGLLGINQEEETVTEEAQNSKENVTDKQNTINGIKDVPSPYNESIEIHKDDASTDKGVGVLVIKNGKILVGNRTDGKGLCGPGGHIEQGETPRQAAIRETIEEFNIVPLELIDLGETESMRQESSSHIFLCTKFLHQPRANNTEIKETCFMSMKKLWESNLKLFIPFKASLDRLSCIMEKELNGTSRNSIIDINKKDSFPEHEGRPGEVGGSLPKDASNQSKAAKKKSVKTEYGKTNIGTALKSGSMKKKTSVAKALGASEQEIKNASTPAKMNKLIHQKALQGFGKGSDKGTKQNFESNYETHKKLIRENQTILVGGKEYTIDSALSSDKVSVKVSVAKELGRATKAKDKVAKEVDEEKKNGTLDEYIKTHTDGYVDKVIKAQEKQVAVLQSDKVKEIHALSVNNNSQVELKCAEKCNDKLLSSKEYYDMLEKQCDIFSGEEYALENSYVNGGLGIRAETFNDKMYSGSLEQLSEPEKRFSEMVSAKSINLPEGHSLYRGVGISYLEKLTGMSANDQGFNENLQSLVGKEITHDSVTSCAPGVVNYFSHSKVICNMKTGKSSKGYIVRSNSREGEIILPPGSKMKVKSVSIGAPYYPMWDNDVSDRRCTGVGTYVDYYDKRELETSKQIYVEMEIE